MSVIRINFLKRVPIILMVMLLALVIAPAMVSAEDEESAFQNPAQVQKAENVVEAIAINTEDAKLPGLLSELDDARETLAGTKPGTPEYPEAQQAVDDAYAAVDERLAEVAGVDKQSISDKREDGYGWGQICHELGVHPSVLGNKYGHQKMSQYNAQARHGFGKKGEISAATTRDVKTGWARGHGKSVSGKSNGKGKADSFDVDNSGKAKGKSNGNSGGGKGGGKGGGNGKK